MTFFDVGLVAMIQSIPSLFEYNGMLIHDLKLSCARKLIFMLAPLASFTVIDDVVSRCLKQGGVIRVYFKKM